MANTELESKGRRITIDLTRAAADELDKLKRVTGLTTAELFRYAFALLRIYVQAKESGQEVRLVDPKGVITTTRLELPIAILSAETERPHAR